MDNWEIYYRTHAKGVGKELKGSPPLSFVSNGQPLADYRIYGASGGVGDRTVNLLRNTTPSQTIEKVSYTVNKDSSVTCIGKANRQADFYLLGSPSTTENLSITIGNSYIISGAISNSAFIRIVDFGYSSGIDAKTPIVFTPTGTSGKIILRVTNGANVNGTFYPMISELTEETQTYEPYGYKVPIVCGGTTTNIYLNEPLGENESISMSDTGVSIPTINGTNILTVDTEVQPSKMYIKYGGSSNVNQSLMKYLEYKYKFAKE